MRDGNNVLDRAIDGGVGKLDRQCRWRRGKGRAHRGRGHADGAEIVGLVSGVLLRPIAIHPGDCRDSGSQTKLGTCPVKPMDVPKGHGKIDGNRDEREP